MPASSDSVRHRPVHQLIVSAVNRNTFEFIFSPKYVRSSGDELIHPVSYHPQTLDLGDLKSDQALIKLTIVGLPALQRDVCIFRL